jgi:hypothetical protein
VAVGELLQAAVGDLALDLRGDHREHLVAPQRFEARTEARAQALQGLGGEQADGGEGEHHAIRALALLDAGVAPVLGLPALQDLVDARAGLLASYPDRPCQLRGSRARWNTARISTCSGSRR